MSIDASPIAAVIPGRREAASPESICAAMVVTPQRW
jgi:hypothetical protein